MAELRAVGLVSVSDVRSQSGSPEKQMTLDDKFKWFLSEAFVSVRNLPPYYSKMKEEELGGHFADTYAQSILLNSVLPRTNILPPMKNPTGFDANLKKTKYPKLQQQDCRIKEKSSVTTDMGMKSNTMKSCSKCGTELEAFYMKVHCCEGTD